jgi:hypothetical protein
VFEPKFDAQILPQVQFFGEQSCAPEFWNLISGFLLLADE